MMNKKLIFFLLVLVIAGTLFLGNNNLTQGKAREEAATKLVEINVSAASSMSEALMEIKEEYIKDSEIVPVFNFGASGMLEKQIAQGAPCDLYISAAKEHMDSLEKEGFLIEGSRIDFLGNSLTLIASEEMANKISNLKSIITEDINSISIGEPISAPVGNYAKQALQSEELWDFVQEKIIYAKDAKQILEYVNSGNVDCAIVYKTDARLLKSGKVIAELPATSHDPIVYPIALLSDSINQDAARDFYQFLQKDYAKSIFEKFGFTVL